jgi:cytoskeletal protein CcmA (bactofilin family)
MWDRKETERDRFEPQPVRTEPPRTVAAPAFQPKTAHANIGQSLFIKGEVSGSEDLMVEGRVEGRIDLKDHNLTIGPNGRVHAEIHAKNISIVGEVTGNVVADEKVDLTDTGRLVGDIRAPRIAVSDGAQFKGSVDMVQVRAGATDKVQPQQKDKNLTATPQAQAVQVAQAGKAIQ